MSLSSRILNRSSNIFRCSKSLSQYILESIELLERNTWWNQDSVEFMNSLLDRANNQFVKKYIKSTFRKYLDQEYPAEISNSPDLPDWAKGKEVHELSIPNQDKEKFSHYIDYLNTLPERPISMSFKDLESHVKSWESQLQKSNNSDEDGIELLHKYPDGYSWVKVFGEASLKREGDLMGHCVGGYCDRVESGNTIITSLRDPNNKPHVTMEITRRKIIQIQGNQNTTPKKQYIKYIKDFLDKKYVEYNDADSGYLSKIDMILANGKILPLSDLPEYIEGDLNIIDKDQLRLPSKLRVTGSLDIHNCSVDKFPDFLEADRVVISDCNTHSELPNNLKSVSLEILHTDFDHLPDNLDITYLFISASRISKLPDGLNLPNGMNLDRVNIEELPSDIKIGKSLSLDGTRITELPDNLVIPDHLYVDKHIRELPHGLKVGILHLNQDSPINELPDDIVISKGIRAKYSGLRKLPDNMSVSGNVDLRKSEISELPKNLEVGGNLYLSGTNITELPDDLVVHGNLDIINTKIKKIPSGAKIYGEIIKDFDKPDSII